MKYNDILLGDFDDSFHNLTYKDSMFFTWARFDCPDLAYIFKGDDDTLPWDLKKTFFSINRYRTVCRLRAMRIFALEFISKNEDLSRKRRGAKCTRGDTQSCGELFFQSCIG